MNKIATCIITTLRGASIVEVALRECKRHGIDLACTRIGRVHTRKGGWLPAVFIVQEFQATAEQIEASVMHHGCAAFHIQGSPETGTVQQYTTGQPLLHYGLTPHETQQIIEYNGATLHVQA